MTSSAVVRQTVRMAWMQVHAGQDHLSQFTNRKPVDALVEMIWNGLDAEADLVTVDFETASISTSLGSPSRTTATGSARK